MSNAIYPKYKEALLNASANSALTGSGTTGLYAALIDTGTYTYSSSHEFYSSLSGVVGTDQEITSVTLTNGLIDGADVTYPSCLGQHLSKRSWSTARTPARARPGAWSLTSIPPRRGCR